jgi:hypothetical protein
MDVVLDIPPGTAELEDALALHTQGEKSHPAPHLGPQGRRGCGVATAGGGDVNSRRAGGGGGPWILLGLGWL